MGFRIENDDFSAQSATFRGLCNFHVQHFTLCIAITGFVFFESIGVFQLFQHLWLGLFLCILALIFGLVVLGVYFRRPLLLVPFLVVQAIQVCLLGLYWAQILTNFMVAYALAFQQSFYRAFEQSLSARGAATTTTNRPELDGNNNSSVSNDAETSTPTPNTTATASSPQQPQNNGGEMLFLAADVTIMFVVGVWTLLQVLVFSLVWRAKKSLRKRHAVMITPLNSKSAATTYATVPAMLSQQQQQQQQRTPNGV